MAAELASGVAKSGSIRNRQALEMFLAPLMIMPFDEPACWSCGDLRAEPERRGTLITNNTREFAMVPGLELDNWVSPA